jgi:general secretion pathway protein H
VKRARLGGFSLLELLVVVAIIGIFVGVAVLSVDVTGDDRESEQEIFRLKTLIDLLREDALLQGTDYGVYFSQAGYQFYYYDYDRRSWLLPPTDGLLTERSLPPDLEMAVTVDDRDVTLQSAPDLENGETAVPQIMILSSGEMTPFTLELYRDVAGPRLALTAEFDGDMEIERHE